MHIPKDFNLRTHLKKIQGEYILFALKEKNYCIAKAAKMLGLQRTTLVEKIRHMDNLPKQFFNSHTDFLK